MCKLGSHFHHKLQVVQTCPNCVRTSTWTVSRTLVGVIHTNWESHSCPFLSSIYSVFASWKASSGVGVTTRAKTPKGSSTRRCNIGIFWHYQSEITLERHLHPVFEERNAVAPELGFQYRALLHVWVAHSASRDRKFTELSHLLAGEESAYWERHSCPFVHKR